MAIPIPNKAPGFRFGSYDGAAIVMDIYSDFQCPFSAKAFPMNVALIQKYARERKEVCITVHPFSLPWHRQSIYGWRTALAVAGDDANRWLEFATLLHSQQKSWTNDACKNKTETEIVAAFAALAVQFSASHADAKAVTAEEWVKRIESEDTYLKVKLPFRLGIQRGVWSVPTYFVNGSEANKMTSSSTMADWDALLEPIVKANTTAAAKK